MFKNVGRTRARVQAIQILFQSQVLSQDVFDVLRQGDYALENGPIDPFAEELARGVAVNRLAIERMLDNISTCWSYSRMPIVDRTIMAVALFEMFMQDDTPTSVAISEAVEISKVYGGDDSSNFVNGILGNIARLKDEQPTASLAVLANEVAELKAAQHPVMDDEDFGAGEIEADREDYEFLEAVEGEGEADDEALADDEGQSAEQVSAEGVVE